MSYTFRGYSYCKTTVTNENGDTEYQEDIVYMPDKDTEIKKTNSGVIKKEDEEHYLTDKELNEIMEEMESPEELE